MGILKAMMDRYDLTAEEHQEMMLATEADGEPSDGDLLIMQYHIHTEDYAQHDEELRNLHSITTAYFARRYPRTVTKATEIIERHTAAKARH